MIKDINDELSEETDYGKSLQKLHGTEVLRKDI